jgi:diaminopimelate epimerase
MVLLNADGSRAEMSGNGIGCLAQAAVLGGHAAGPDVRVRTDAGFRVVSLREAAAAPPLHEATVAMGPVRLSDDGSAASWTGDRVRAALLVDVGNPHLVLHAADGSVVRDREWLVDVGRKANVEIEAGINVEIVAVDAGGALQMDVFERGVGLTDACGTGAVATAAAARQWGIAGDRSTVVMAGGPVDVVLEGQEATLTTPIAYVAAVDFPWP